MFSYSRFLTVVAAVSGLAAPLTINKRQSSVPYGVQIYSCTQPGVVALTFDDGPTESTAMVLDKLAAAGQRATFFINGANRASIWDYTATVHRYINEGHQIGAHTWSHPNLPTLSYDQIVAEMTTLEDAITAIVGFFPTYMRVPYFDYGDHVLPVMADLKYHVIHCDVDTNDWQYQTEDTIWQAAEAYKAGLNAGATISLAHDPLWYTSSQLVDNMLHELAIRGLRSVPVGECLGDPAANWYRTSRV